MEIRADGAVPVIDLQRHGDRFLDPIPAHVRPAEAHLNATQRSHRHGKLRAWPKSRVHLDTRHHVAMGALHIPELPFGHVAEAHVHRSLEELVI